jgi:hypothetical protein
MFKTATGAGGFQRAVVAVGPEAVVVVLVGGGGGGFGGFGGGGGGGSGASIIGGDKN